MNIRTLVLKRIQESIEVKNAILEDNRVLNQLEEMIESICISLKNGNKIIFGGNGGSFADCIHLAAEFVSRFTMEREPLASLALGANNSILTAVGNDYDFGTVFVRELKALGQPGDVFIGLSTSGNSENIIRCINEAKAMDLVVYALTGQSGGKMNALCDCIKMPSEVTARIQEAHITLGHILCELVEKRLF